MILIWRVCHFHIFRLSVSGVQPRALFYFVQKYYTTSDTKRE